VTSRNIEWWPSPAKINLFLHVCGQYENGYHSLQTLFQLLDFGDQIGIELTQSGKVQLVDEISGVANVDNLIYKAAQLLINHKPNEHLGAKIHLRKKIPMGGGLGGGSSNAATVLIALNYMWDCQLSMNELLTLGVKLGADVPVFINGHSAFAQGIGEQLTNTHIPEAYYLVATPKTNISTQAIFTHPDLPRNTRIFNITDYKIVKN
jgi:4-diphosphocytidyl-2-C-methyl-D-erythritol kinase